LPAPSKAARVIQAGDTPRNLGRSTLVVQCKFPQAHAAWRRWPKHGAWTLGKCQAKAVKRNV